MRLERLRITISLERKDEKRQSEAAIWNKMCIFAFSKTKTHHPHLIIMRKIIYKNYLI